MKKILCFALAACLLLSGCGVITDTSRAGEKVPVSVLDLSDFKQPGRMDTSAVYYLNTTNNTLTAEPRKLMIEQDTNPAKTAVEALLQGPSNDSVSGVAKPGMTLDFIEFSNDVANVYIQYDGDPLPTQDAFILEQAIANTVTDILGPVSTCVFYNGIRKGIGGYPSPPLKKQLGNVIEAFTGAYAKAVPRKPEDDSVETPETYTTESVPQNNQQNTIDMPTVLYFVAASGDYILPEVRTITYTPGSYVKGAYMEGNYIETVIEELKRGPQNTAVMKSPLLPESQLVKSPSKTNNGNDTYRLALWFNTLPLGAHNEELLSYAALIYTLTGLIPNISNVDIFVDNNQVTGGTGAEAAGSQRSHYFGHIGSSAKIYLEDKDSDLLLEVSRSMEQGQIWSAKSRLLELIRGPIEGDSENADAVMPSGITKKDILSVEVNNDMAYVNLSAAFKKACEGFGDKSEMLLVYAMVNTLTAVDGISKVQFLLEGQQIDTLAGHLCLSDAFLKNYGIIKKPAHAAKSVSMRNMSTSFSME